MDKQQFDQLLGELSEVTYMLCNRRQLTEKQRDELLATYRQHWIGAEADEFKHIDSILEELVALAKRTLSNNVWKVIKPVFTKYGVSV